MSLYRQYGIECFKIDGLQIPTKQAEENLRHLFDKVALETDHHVIFNLDATAGRRGGYHSMNEYGNIFWRIDILIGETTILIVLCAICGNCLVMFLLKKCR